MDIIQISYQIEIYPYYEFQGKYVNTSENLISSYHFFSLTKILGLHHYIQDEKLLRKFPNIYNFQTDVIVYFLDT